MSRLALRSFIILSLVLLASSRSQPAATSQNTGSRPQALPPVVNGWREYPLRDGVISIMPNKWRTDTIDVPVATGKGLEYRLAMKKGETLVYNVSYGTLADAKQMIVEFHGHTPQVNGVGDLMFYSKTGGTPQSGAFTAPWDGIHGWYLKNESARDVVVRLELAGFYALESR